MNQSYSSVDTLFGFTDILMQLNERSDLTLDHSHVSDEKSVFLQCLLALLKDQIFKD